MNFIKKVFGKIIYGISRFLDITLGLFIDILDAIVNLIHGVGMGILRLFGFGILLLVIFLAFPMGIFLISPIVIRVIFIFLIIPLIAEYLSNGLVFLKYVLTEYLYDRANYFIDGSKVSFNNIGDYAREYIRLQEEKRRRAEEARRKAEEQRRREEQKRWEEFINNSGWSSFNRGGFQGQRSSGTGFDVMNIGFKEEYEKSCDILGISYNADKDEIRRAYRQKAKEYHPDLNRSENATEMFQKINDAHEFLNESNINRYRNMN